MPRTENSRADAFAKLATTSQEDLGGLIVVEYLPKPSVSINNGEVSPVMSKPSWMDPIWDYLVEGTLLSNPKRHPNSGQGRQGSLFIREPFKNEASLRPSLSA